MAANYRTTDPIANLLLRLTIRRRAGAGVAPYDGLLDAESLPADRQRELEEVSRTYQWQAKEFSPAELLLYTRAARLLQAGESTAALGDLTGPLHQHYLQLFRQRLEQGNTAASLLQVPDSGMLLYTITDRDMALPRAEVTANFLSGTSTRPGSGALATGLPSLAASSTTSPAAAKYLGRELEDALFSGSSAVQQGASLQASANSSSAMVLMAAVGLRPGCLLECLEGGTPTTWMDVPLAIVRWHAPGEGEGGSGRLEMRPGFADPLPYRRGSLVSLVKRVSGETAWSGREAVRLLMRLDTPLGKGKFGGTLRLRPLPQHLLSTRTAAAGRATVAALTSTSSTSSSSSSSSSSADPSTLEEPGVLAYASEMHRFQAPDGSQWEYSVVNPDEDIAAVVASSGEGGPGEAARLAEYEAALAAEQTRNDAEAVARAADQGLGASAALAVPRELRDPPAFAAAAAAAFRLSVYVELVAAARFLGPSALYIVYQLALPRGSGWRLLQGQELGAGGAADSFGEPSWNPDVPVEGEVLLGEEASGAAVSFGSPEAAAAAARTGPARRAEAAAVASGRPAGPGARELLTPGGDGTGRSRWLAVSPLGGVTQLARFTQRPWTFGSPLASQPSGALASEHGLEPDAAGAAAGAREAHAYFGGSSSAGEPCGQGRSSSSSSSSSSSPHPFGFTQNAASSPQGGKAAPGVRRAAAGARGGAGASSVSMVSSLDEGLCGAPGQPSAAWAYAMPEASACTPVAHLNYPFPIHLAFCPEACINPAGPSPPLLFLTALSVDGAGRHSVEGYTCSELPGAGGCRDAVLRCWAPTDDSCAESNFFLGGSARLSDVTAARVPAGWVAGSAWRGAAGEEGPGAAASLPALTPGAAASIKDAMAGLSRLGAASVTTGEVAVRYNVIKQVRRGGGGGAAPGAAAAPFGASAAAQGAGAAAAAAAAARSTQRGASSLTAQQVIEEAKALRKRDTLAGRLEATRKQGSEAEGGAR